MITDAEELLERTRPRRRSTTTNQLNQFRYLFYCFKRLHASQGEFDKLEQDAFRTSETLLLNMCRTLLNIFETPGVSASQSSETSDLSLQLLNLIVDCFENAGDEEQRLLQRFYDLLVKQFDESSSVRSFFSNSQSLQTAAVFAALPSPMQEDEHAELTFLLNIFAHLNARCSLVPDCDDYSSAYRRLVHLVKFLTRSPLMKYLFIYASFGTTERPLKTGRDWQQSTLVGKLLSPHVLPLQYGDEIIIQHFKYFKRPTHMNKCELETDEESMLRTQSLISGEIIAFFYDHLLRQSSHAHVQAAWLRWLGACMRANNAKRQEWTNISDTAPAESDGHFASHGFCSTCSTCCSNTTWPFATPSRTLFSRSTTTTRRRRRAQRRATFLRRVSRRRSFPHRVRPPPQTTHVKANRKSSTLSPNASTPLTRSFASASSLFYSG